MTLTGTETTIVVPRAVSAAVINLTIADFTVPMATGPDRDRRRLWRFHRERGDHIESPVERRVALVASIVLLVPFSLPPLHKIFRRPALLKAKGNLGVARRVERTFARSNILWHVMRDRQVDGQIIDAICIGPHGAVLIELAH
jgi:hypothetical protein